MSFIEVLVPNTEQCSVLAKISEAIRPEAAAGKSAQAIARAEQLGRKAAKELNGISSFIAALMEHRGPIGVVIVNFSALCGLELAKLPPTPTVFVARDEHQLTNLDIMRAALIGAAGGYCYSYSSQANGTLSDDVFPIQAYAEVSGFSAGKDLGWHTEDASFSRSSDDQRHSTFDTFSFAYLRNPNGDPTKVSMPDLGKLDRSVLDALRRPQFVAKTSVSHEGDRNTIAIPTSFVYGGDKLRFSFARLSELLDGYRETGLIDVIDAFVNLLDSSADEIPGTPSTIAFIDNMRVAHARGTWKKSPKFDGTDRWQRRLGFAKTSRQAFIETLMPDPLKRLIDAEQLKKYLSNLPPS